LRLSFSHWGPYVLGNDRKRYESGKTSVNVSRETLARLRGLGQKITRAAGGLRPPTLDTMLYYLAGGFVTRAIDETPPRRPSRRGKVKRSPVRLARTSARSKRATARRRKAGK